MPERGSEPARYEDKLRGRATKVYMPMSEGVLGNRHTLVSAEERDALADAVEAAREHLRAPNTYRYERLAAALRRLDGLGGSA